jgi:hypothetical protein
LAEEIETKPKINEKEQHLEMQNILGDLDFRRPVRMAGAQHLRHWRNFSSH